MHSDFLLNLILFVFTNLISAVDTDLADTLNYESFLADEPMSWDESALSSNQPVFMASNDVASLSFSSLDDLNSDTSEMLFSSENTIDDSATLSSPFDTPLSTDSSQQPGCLTSSDSLSVFDRSRFRRRDDPGLCRNSVKVTWPDLPGLRELRTKPNAQLRINQAVGNPTFNGLCYLYSLGVAPYGICSSGDPKDVEPSVEGSLEIWTYGNFFTYEVTHGSLGMLINMQFTKRKMGKAERTLIVGAGILMMCPGVTQNLFCCADIEPDEPGMRGKMCVLWSILLFNSKPYT